MKKSIAEYLLSQGWKLFEDGFINHREDLYVDLGGRLGYTWELRQFTDSDVDGVAKGRWKPLNEGDTLAELQELV